MTAEYTPVEEATLKLVVSLLKGGNDGVQMVCRDINSNSNTNVFSVAHFSKTEAHDIIL